MVIMLPGEKKLKGLRFGQMIWSALKLKYPDCDNREELAKNLFELSSSELEDIINKFLKIKKI